MKSESIKLLRSIITGMLLAGLVWSCYRFWLSPGAGSGFVAVAALGSLATWWKLSLPPAPPAESGDLSEKNYTTSTPLRLALTWNDGAAGSFTDITAERSQIISWCIGAAAGRSIGEDHWTGSAGPFSKGQYHIFRDELLEAGLVRQRGKHHSQGFELTAKGRAMARAVAARFQTHSLSPSRSPSSHPPSGGKSLAFLTHPSGYAHEREGESK